MSGHAGETAVSEAVKKLAAYCLDIHVLGAYTTEMEDKAN